MNKLELSEKALSEVIAKCKRGDKLGQEVLFRLFAPRILTTCRRYELPEFGAEDILLETFMIVFEKIKQYEEEKGKIEPWIRKIAVNVALKFIRGNKIIKSETEDYLTGISAIEEDISEIQSMSPKAILDVVKQLPVGYRTVFNMYLIEGYTHDEIAQYLNISTGTSMSQLSKAKKMVKKILLSKTGKVRSLNLY